MLTAEEFRKLPSDVKDIVALCQRSTKATAEVFFPERFTTPFSPGHLRLFELLDDTTTQKLAVFAHRGFGKTTILNVVSPAQKIMFHDRRYIVQCSETADLAIQHSDTLRKELMTNAMVEKCFGSIKSAVSSDGFSKERWVTAGGIMVLPRGTGQQIRGLLHGRSRPDLLNFDDIESPKANKSDVDRENLKRWFWSDALGCVDRHDPNWRVRVIGNIVGEDCLLKDLIDDDKNWRHEFLPLFEKEGHKSLWPEHMSDAEVEAMIAEYELHYRLTELYLDYIGEYHSPDSPFQKEHFQRYREGTGEWRLNEDPDTESVVIVDPARTTESTSCDTAIVGIAISLKKHEIYVREVVSRKMRPDEIFDEAFNMCHRLKAVTLGIEVTGLHDFITHPVLNEIIKRGLAINLVELKATAEKSKNERIAALSPFYRLRHVWHEESCAQVIESQLLNFPGGKQVDVIDAFSYIIRMMSLGDRFFSPPDVDDKDIEDEYESLEYEPALAGDWRMI